MISIEYDRTGKHYPDRLGKSDFIDLIDLCSIQGDVDFSAVAQAGVKGVYIKSSQYSTTWDHRYGLYVAQAKAAGLAVGAYHFAFCGSDPIAQARFFLKASQGDDNEPMGRKPGELPPMLDLEFAKGIPSKDLVAWGEAFMFELEQNMPSEREVKAIWYTFPHFAKSQLQPELQNSKLAQRPLCLARYKDDMNGKLIGWYPEDNSTPDLVPAGCTPVLWQYSGNNGYRVPGIQSDCDRQVFLGSSADWDRFRGIERPVDTVSKDVIEDSVVRPEEIQVL